MKRRIVAIALTLAMLLSVLPVGITDSKGQVVMDHTMWTTAGKYYDGDHIVVKDSSFVNGEA